MNHLFTDNDRYTDEGLAISAEISKALEPILKKWSERGYSMRGISHIASVEAHLLECEIILTKQIKERKETNGKYTINQGNPGRD